MQKQKSFITEVVWIENIIEANDLQYFYRAIYTREYINNNLLIIDRLNALLSNLKTKKNLKKFDCNSLVELRRNIDVLRNLN